MCGGVEQIDLPHFRLLVTVLKFPACNNSEVARPSKERYGGEPIMWPCRTRG
jgi:hypothetical protein